MAIYPKDFKILKKASNSSEIDTPLVSIVIPTYNRSNFIRDAIRSAISQDYQSFEIVICDNHSTDDTIPQVMRIASGLDNITVLLWDMNVGPVANWLSGVEQCRGQYVKILFSDDELNNDCLSQMVANMSEGIGFVYSACLVGESRSTATLSYVDSSRQVDSPAVYHSSRGFTRYMLGRSMPVSPCAALFPKDIILNSLSKSMEDPPCCDALNLGAGPDIKIFFDALIHNPYYCHIPNPLVFFKSHSQSFTNGRNAQVRRCYARSISKYSKSFPLYARLLRKTKLFLDLPKTIFKLIAKSSSLG